MSTSTNSTKRDDVKTYVAAARSALEGYKREVQEEVDRKLALLSEAERWTDNSGPIPRRITRYIKLTELQEDRCAKGCSSGCKHSKAHDELNERYYSPIGYDFDAPVFVAFRMVAGEGPDLDDAMDSLSSSVSNELNNSRVGERVMTQAFAAAGYVPPLANDEPDFDPARCSPELHDEGKVVDLEDARLSNEIAELEQRANAQRDKLDAIAKLVEGMSPARPRHLTLVVSNDVKRSSDDE